MAAMPGRITINGMIILGNAAITGVRRAADMEFAAMARWTTLFGVALSIAAAYMAQAYNNIMDVLQLVFSFVNAPLFATFLLGMFWKRTTGHGAFWGLLAGMSSAATVHGLTVAEGKGGWITSVHQFPSTMAQNLWMAIFAWSACFVITLLVSLATRPRPAGELRGLVYSLTARVADSDEPWHRRPAVLALIVGTLVVMLNLIYW